MRIALLLLVVGTWRQVSVRSCCCCCRCPACTKTPSSEWSNSQWPDRSHSTSFASLKELTILHRATYRQCPRERRQRKSRVMSCTGAAGQSTLNRRRCEDAQTRIRARKAKASANRATAPCTSNANSGTCTCPGRLLRYRPCSTYSRRCGRRNGTAPGINQNSPGGPACARDSCGSGRRSQRCLRRVNRSRGWSIPRYKKNKAFMRNAERKMPCLPPF